MSNLAPTPKVAAAVVAGIIASTILANVDLITPELFDGLGKWSHLVYGLVITLAMSSAGWLKSEGDKSAAPDTSAAVVPDVAPAAPVEPAPAATFPKAAVDAALAAEPAPAVEVTPVYTAPVAPVA